MANKAINAGVWYTVSDLFLKALSIITAPIFTRLLTTGDYGIASNFTSWQNILACFFGLCLSYSVGRAKIDFKEDFDGYLSSIQGLSSLFAIILFIVAWPFLEYLSDFLIIDKPLLIALFVLLIFNPSVEYLRAKYRFEYRYKENILISVVSAISNIILSIVLILLSDSSGKAAGKIWGYAIPTIIISVVCYVIILRNGKKLFNGSYWRYALKYSLPMIPHGLAMIILAQIDRIMIIKMVGDSEAGIYSFGYSYAIIISTITNAVVRAWQPWLYDSLVEGKIEDVKRSDKMMNMLGCLLAVFFVAVAPEVLMILGAKSFWVAKWMVMPVIVGTLYQFFYNKFVFLELYSKKTYYIAVGSVLAAFVNYILNVIFIPKYGYVAAAYTTLAGYLLLMFFHWIIVSYIIKENAYDNRHSWILAAITFFVCYGIMMLYDNIALRYFVCLLLLIIYYSKYKSFVNNIVTKGISNIKNKLHGI